LRTENSGGPRNIYEGIGNKSECTVCSVCFIGPRRSLVARRIAAAGAHDARVERGFWNRRPAEVHVCGPGNGIRRL